MVSAAGLNIPVFVSSPNVYEGAEAEPSPALTTPEKVISPLTSNAVAGSLVPIPTLPLESIRIRSALAVFRAIVSIDCIRIPLESS